MATVRKCAAYALIFLVVETFAGRAMASTDFQVIVNKANQTATLERRSVAEMFLKKVRQWRNDRIILPVDLVTNSMVRSEFSEEILNRTVSAVRMYWQQQLFSGRGVPPPELKSEKDVVDYVSSHPDAIGYVSEHADVHNVRIVQIEE